MHACMHYFFQQQQQQNLIRKKSRMHIKNLHHRLCGEHARPQLRPLTLSWERPPRGACTLVVNVHGQHSRSTFTVNVHGQHFTVNVSRSTFQWVRCCMALYGTVWCCMALYGAVWSISNDWVVAAVMPRRSALGGVAGRLRRADERFTSPHITQIFCVNARNAPG